MPNDPSRRQRPAQPPAPGETAPPPPEEDSSRASATGSGSDGFIADPGPAFDPSAEAVEEGAPPPPAAPPPAALEVEWEQEAIESVLGLQGRVLHGAIGVAEQDWVHTEADLAAIAPPLTRICNRYEPIRAYARHADPLALAMGLGAYAARSLIERRSALGELEADGGTQPIPPLEGEPPAPASQAPSPETAPRATSAPPMQPSEGPAPPPPPRPAEAPIDPTEVDWQVGGG